MPATTGQPQRSVPQSAPPRWPATAAVVLVGWCLIAWTVFGAGINTAPFFGETPSRSQYVESGMACLTAVLPLVLLLVVGLLWGSRWGLLLLALPTVLLVPLGLSLLSEPGDPADPDHGRSAQASDAFAGLTRLNWGGALLLLLVVAVVLVVRRRTARRADAPTP